MEIEKILKVKFLKSSDCISTTGQEIIEINVEFNQLLDIISEIELKKNLFGKNLHKEAFTGVDYLGNKVSFSSYVVWQHNGKIYKYNFDENLMPFNAELISRNREEKIQTIINKHESHQQKSHRENRLLGQHVLKNQQFLVYNQYIILIFVIWNTHSTNSCKR